MYVTLPMRMGAWSISCMLRTVWIEYYYCFTSITIDVNECDLEGVVLCDQNAECTNKIGGFDCTCDAGYNGTGLTCSKFYT